MGQREQILLGKLLVLTHTHAHARTHPLQHIFPADALPRSPSTSGTQLQILSPGTRSAPGTRGVLAAAQWASLSALVHTRWPLPTQVRIAQILEMRPASHCLRQ